ncbi:PA14 domain-containing protein [Bacillus sp. SCS-151]|uniref:PA14 domain-containing protein n=1 Tax=Nanhaiella sioensis TaxID=3115293 RepID=UPI00397BD7AA
MNQHKAKNRFISILTILALTIQLASFAQITTYATDIESQITQLKVQKEKEEPIIITNGLKGTYYSDDEFTNYLLIRSEDSDASFNINSIYAPSSLQEKIENVHSIKWDGFVQPEYSEEYTFTTSDNDHIKLWVNGELLINGQELEPQSILLKANQQYSIAILYSNAEAALSELDIKWSSSQQEEETIPKERLFPPVQGEESVDQQPKTKSTVSSAPTPCTEGYDGDADCIPDDWEMEGFTYIFGVGLVEWDDEYLDQWTMYNTDPSQKSTDQDPYTDYMEATKVNMDRAVLSPGDHPLVPAYPDIEVTLDGFDYTPNETITLTDGSSISNTQSFNTQTYDLTTITNGFNSSVEYGMAVKASLNPFNSGAESHITFSSGYDYSDTRQSGTVSWEAGDATEATNWSTATTTTPDEAAFLDLKVHYTNRGTAPIYDFVPTIGVQLGGEDIETFDPQIAAKLLKADDQFPYTGSVVMNSKADGSKISLTIDQLQKLNLGYPIIINDLQISQGTISVDGESEDWNHYLSQIENTSATIRVQNPNTKEYEERKVFANRGQTYQPEVTLGDALISAFNAELDGSGNLIIDGHHLDENWTLIGDADTNETIQQYVDEIRNLSDIPLRPGMQIDLRKIDPNDEPVISFAYYLDNNIQAFIAANGKVINNISAVINGKEYDMVYNLNTGVYELESPLSDVDMDSTVTVNVVFADSNGETKVVSSNVEVLQNQPTYMMPLNLSDFENNQDKVVLDNQYLTKIDGELGNVTKEFIENPEGGTYTFSVYLQSDREQTVTLWVMSDEETFSQDINVGTSLEKYEVTGTFENDSDTIEVMISKENAISGDSKDPLYAYSPSLTRSDGTVVNDNINWQEETEYIGDISEAYSNWMKNSSIEMNDNGDVVEFIYRDDHVYMDNDMRGTVDYRVGQINGSEINWESNWSYFGGHNADIALDNSSRVISVAQESEDESDLTYVIKEIKHNIYGEPFSTLYNISNEVVYANGLNPSIAINDDGTVIAVHEKDGVLVYNTGYINQDRIEWNNEDGDGRAIGTEYATGQNPTVDINSNGTIVVAHRGVNNNPDKMYYAVGELQQNGVITWSETRDNGRSRGTVYAFNGDMPKISITDKGDVFETHVETDEDMVSYGKYDVFVNKGHIRDGKIYWSAADTEGITHDDPQFPNSSIISNIATNYDGTKIITSRGFNIWGSGDSSYEYSTNRYYNVGVVENTFDFTNWESIGLTVDKDDVLSVNGERVLKLSVPGNSGLSYLRNDVNINPQGKEYTFSVWLRADEEQLVTLRIRNAEKDELEDVDVLVTSDWAKYEVSQFFDAESSFIRTTIYPNGKDSNPKGETTVYAYGAELTWEE